MEIYAFVLEFIFFFTTIVGLSGNITVLLTLLKIVHKGYKFMKAEVILSHLAWANLLICLTQGVPHSLYVFGVRDLFTDIMCKIILFVFRSARALAIMFTCLLSCFQCTTIAQNTETWLNLKFLMQRYMLLLFMAVYVVSMVTSSNLPMFTVGSRNLTALKYTFNLGYCLVIYPDQLSIQGVGFGIFGRDLVCVFVMAAASVYILLILHRHGKQVVAIRAAQQNKDRNAETQASKTVVTLVIVYVTLFGLDCMIWFYQIIVSTEVHPMVSSTRYYFTMCYSSAVPIVILVLNKKIRSKLQMYLNMKKTDLKEVS
ncbi:olfactory receptor class A-like protein 1 [Ambystoma mexicanum]|uniref:olfactory receptor class A-like protein 1 n=1 Tax=Ambystoma mexicanum TaxID=8296 RepID=UPI0037E7F980